MNWNLTETLSAVAVAILAAAGGWIMRLQRRVMTNQIMVDRLESQICEWREQDSRRDAERRKMMDAVVDVRERVARMEGRIDR